MKNKILLFIVTVFCFGCAATVNVAQNQTNETPELISLNSDRGMKLFQEAEYKVDFFPLANNFQSQSNGFVCGAATASIILNTLEVNALRNDEVKINKDTTSIEPANRTSDNDPFLNRFTQNNIFDASYISSSANAKIKSKDEVLGKQINGKSDGGFQIRQLEALFNAHGLKSNLHIVADDSDSGAIKNEIVKNMSEPNNYVVVNYKRGALGQKGGGHISPLGAYNKKSDSVLVMDVNPSKADWVWVHVNDLIAAMRTKDTVENRGYLLISK